MNEIDIEGVTLLYFASVLTGELMKGRYGSLRSILSIMMMFLIMTCLRLHRLIFGRGSFTAS